MAQLEEVDDLRTPATYKTDRTAYRSLGLSGEWGGVSLRGAAGGWAVKAWARVRGSDYGAWTPRVPPTARFTKPVHLSPIAVTVSPRDLHGDARASRRRHPHPAPPVSARSIPTTTVMSRDAVLKGALGKCGYQRWTFNKALKPSDQSKKTPKCTPLTNRNKANITIPYVQGVSEKLRRIFQNFNIATNFKPQSTLRQRLVHPKDRPRKGSKADVIYRLKCEEPNCNNTYIGETSRSLNERYKEHCANRYSSAIFHHLKHNQGHSFNLESTDILDREPRWFERGVREAIFERIYNPTLNRKGGLRVELSGTWDIALGANQL
ncbi:Hypp4412 [Branchiostoma lanceolatum]|uniref:Hypp4412 protein n=1 Tax=Branchiostoma lanceolatum TaxID=7740 RepID=A0A8K0A7J9_BRALA|nr:Hypp4412 [Branchiostoma lanceolatum]